MIQLLSKAHTFARLADVAGNEPPRVRALLGALGEKLGTKSTTLKTLRQSLNPLSKFDFGIFADMSNAKAWQAKGNK